MALRLHGSLAGLSAVMFAFGSVLVGCSDDPATPTPTADAGFATDLGTPTDTGTATDRPVVTDTPVATDTPAPAPARLRVVHAAPGAPNVDIYAAGATTAAATNVPYGTATGYLNLPPGPIAFDIRAAGAMGAPAFTTPTVTLVAGRSYTVVAAGRLGSTDAADRFRVLPLEEGFAADATGARVRVVHAGSDAPTVGIDVGNNGPATPEVPSLARFADTGAEGVSLPADMSLQIGITAGGSTVTAFTTPALGAGNQWIVIATGLLPSTDTAVDNGFGLLAVNQLGIVAFVKQNPRVHVVHAGVDAPAVDLFAGPAGAGANTARTLQIVDNLSYPTRTGTTTTGGLASVQVPPGSYGIDIFPFAAGAMRPAGAPAFTVPTLALAPGRQYVAIAANFLTPPTGGAAFTVIPLEYAMTADAMAATAPRIVAVHAAGNAPTVDIGVQGASFTPVFTGVPRGASSAAAGTTVPTTPFTLAVRAAGTTTNAATFAVDLDVNQRIFVIAAGALSPRMGDQGFGLHAVLANPGTVQLGAGAWSLARLNPNP